MYSKNSLKQFIEQKRTIMIEAANRYGIGAEITIRHSQELDKLLNEYRGSMLKNKKDYIAEYNYGTL